jgi:hypothetical protein
MEVFIFAPRGWGMENRKIKAMVRGTAERIE